MSNKIHPLYQSPLPSDWDLVTVADVASREKSSCVAGPFGSSISSKYFVDSGVPVIRGSNLRNDLTKFVPEGFVFVSHEQASRYKAQHVRSGDLVFTCWGTVGQVGIIPKDGPYSEYIISNKQLKLRPNLQISDPNYLFYYFAGPAMVQHVLGKAIGAAVPGINLGILKNLPVVLPPLPTQRRIAGILSAYDDLIENCQRRIKILEDMARGLYREWFVDFRFPGHQKVKMVKSAMGMVPEGWEAKLVSQIISRKKSATVYRETSLKPEGTIPVIDQSTADILGFHDANPDFNASPENPIAVFGDHTCKMQLLITPFSIGPNVVAFAGNENLPTIYAYFTVNGLVQTEEYKRHWTSLNSKNVLIPDIDLANQFSKLIQPILVNQTTLTSIIRTLRRTRDLLLPQLLSGQLTLPD